MYFQLEVDDTVYHKKPPECLCPTALQNFFSVVLAVQWNHMKQEVRLCSVEQKAIEKAWQW